MKNEKEWNRMMQQKLYHPLYLQDDSWEKMQEIQAKFNRCAYWENTQALDELKKHLGKAYADSVLIPPVYFDHGNRIFLGRHFYANYGLTILDANTVVFGDYVYIGPHVCIYTAGHPIDLEGRRQGLEYAKPVIIGNDVWIGGNTVINPGVNIGDDVVIGSGSVVTHSIPSYVVAAGNPCQVIRTITDKERQDWQKQVQEYIKDIQGE